MYGDQRDERALTRTELYEQVWSTSMRQLAAQYGLSDVGLAKLCRRYEIPRPTLGHWAKLEFGKAPDPPALPLASDPTLETVRMPRREAREVTRSHAHEPVPIPADLRRPHPLIRATIRSRRAQSADKGRGRRSRLEELGLPVWVARAAWTRALRLLQALITAIETRGGRVEVEISSRDAHYMYIAAGAGRLGFTLGNAPTPRRTVPGENGSAGVTAPLVLEIWGVGWETGRRRWADGKRQRLETCLAPFLAEAFRLLNGLREKRERFEAAQREHERLVREREELREAVRSETLRVDRLLKEADNWHRSQQLRQYIAAVTTEAVESQPMAAEGLAADQWKAWATAQADRLDPFVKSPPSVLDQRDILEEKLPAPPRYWDC